MTPEASHDIAEDAVGDAHLLQRIGIAIVDEVLTGGRISNLQIVELHLRNISSTLKLEAAIDDDDWLLASTLTHNPESFLDTESRDSEGAACRQAVLRAFRHVTVVVVGCKHC